MKKHLFTCFLGLVCLLGSEIRAHSRVVESPIGADFLHRSQPHRGGETRPDTLSIGDQIPEGIEFSEVLHYDSEKLRLDDYRGKYLILQFWAPSCTASIASLPKVQELEDRFGERIHLLPMTVFSEDQVEEVFSGYKLLDQVDLPLVVNAQNMRSYFPHSSIPHFVIIDPEGKVAAITGMEDITPGNMERLLAGERDVFRYKNDKKIVLGRHDRLISESPQVENKNIWYQSALTGYIPSVGGSMIQEFNTMTNIRIVNRPLVKIYQLAYSGKSLADYFGENRIDFYGFDEEELYTDRTGADYREWMERGDHVFGYELIAPPNRDPYELMREDLRRYFPNIRAEVVQKKRKAYILTQMEGESFPESSSEKTSYEAGGLGLKMKNSQLQGFIFHLNYYFQQNNPYPIIDRTGIAYPIDLVLDAQLSSIESLDKAFSEQGFKLELEEVEIPVLVLTKTADTKLLAP